MTDVLDAAVRTAVPVLAALLACALLRRRSAALRHRVLTGGLIAAAMVVPLSVASPSWTVPLPPAAATSVVTEAFSSVQAAEDATWPATRPSAPDRFRPLALLVWAAGVAAGAALLLLGIVQLFRLTARGEVAVDGHWRALATSLARQYGIGRPIELVTTRSAEILATWGFFRPCVLLPASAPGWDRDRARIALAHELAHIQRGDWAVQIVAQVLRTVFWFNPLLWMLCARLRRESEQACDDVVLATGTPSEMYATHLLAIAKVCRPTLPMPVASLVRVSSLERRIVAMLNAQIDRRRPTRRATCVLLLALLGIGVPVASFDLSAQDAGPRSLTGHVYDTSGAILPGVDVTLIDEQDVRWSTRTDGSGRFDFSPVGAGTYVLELSLPGFRMLRNDIPLEAPRDWVRNFTMQVGELEETITVRAKRPTPGDRPAASQTGGPLRVGGNIKPPRKLEDVRPEYPPSMRDAGLEGVVRMEALIGVDGRVLSVRALPAQVHPEFTQAAEDAVRQWVFSPTLLNGSPVEVQMAVSVRFSLDD